MLLEELLTNSISIIFLKKRTRKLGAYSRQMFLFSKEKP